MDVMRVNKWIHICSIISVILLPSLIIVSYTADVPEHEPESGDEEDDDDDDDEVQ